MYILRATWHLQATTPAPIHAIAANLNSLRAYRATRVIKLEYQVKKQELLNQLYVLKANYIPVLSRLSQD